MTNQEIWNLLCETHNQYRNNQESLIQTLWEAYLSELFGYKKILGEIVPHPSLVIGSTTREIPDILIQKNNEKLFLVELKQYSIPKNDTIEKQLLTYLTHTDMHLSIGILVCEKLYIYCYDFSTNSKTTLEIPFEKDNENGIQFIELFNRENYNESLIRNFVKDANSSVKNVADIRNSITSNLIIELLKQHFIEDYDEEDFTKAIKDLNIAVSRKIKPEENKQTFFSLPYNTPKENLPKTDEEKLKTYLKTVGLKTFVKYFEYYNNPNYSTGDIKRIIQQNENYAYNSLATKASVGKSIINKGLGYEALKIISNANNTDFETIQKAKELLNSQYD